MQQIYNMLTDLRNGQQASDAKSDAKMAELKAELKNELKNGQDAIITQLNANKQETDRKFGELDSAYGQLKQELQEVKSHVENLPVEPTDKVVEAVYAKVTLCLEDDITDLTEQSCETLEERLEQFKGDLVTVETFENRLGTIEADLSELKGKSTERIQSLETEVERLTRELSSRGNAFDARAPNLRARKESLLSTISPTNRGLMRPFDVWCSGGENSNNNNSNSKDNTEHPINLSSTNPWDVWCRGKHSNNKTNYQV